MMQEQNSSGQNYDVFLNSKRNAILPIHLVSIVFKQRCQGNLKIKTSACHIGQYLEIMSDVKLIFVKSSIGIFLIGDKQQHFR